MTTQAEREMGRDSRLRRGTEKNRHKLLTVNRTREGKEMIGRREHREP